MRDKKGVILALTVSAMLIFTLLGLATMNFAGFQGQGIVKKTLLTQAFWVAEAGVQRSITHLSKGVGNFSLSGSIGQDNYNANITAISLVRWTIDSIGSVAPVSKEILVEYGPDVIKGLQSTGPQYIRDPNHVPSREAYADFSFSKLFGFDIFSMTQAQLISMFGGSYTYCPISKGSDKPPDTLSGITFIDYSTPNPTLPNLDGSGLVVIRLKSGTDLSVNGGGHFNGIVWIEGKLSGLGGAIINGAVFVNCGTVNMTTVSGSAEVYYSKADIDAAFANLNINKFNIVSWQEVR